MRIVIQLERPLTEIVAKLEELHPHGNFPTVQYSNQHQTPYCKSQKTQYPKKKKQRYNKKGKCKKDHKNVQANQEIIKDQSQITYLTNNEP